MSNDPSLKKSRRFAFTLNLLLPGTGQLYTGQTALGVFYLTIFGATFITVLILFLRAYAHYVALSTGGGILEGDNLEQLTGAFPVKWLVGLTALAAVVFVASLVSLRLPQPPRGGSPTGNGPPPSS